MAILEARVQGREQLLLLPIEPRGILLSTDPGAPQRLLQTGKHAVVISGYAEIVLVPGDEPGVFLSYGTDDDDVIHDDASELRAEVRQRAFRGAEFLYTLRMPSGTELLSLVPSHHNHSIGEHIGIRIEPDHVVAFERKGYEAYVSSFKGYSEGPGYWGKTFFIWPPDPRGPSAFLDPNNSANWANNGAKDWRQRFFRAISAP